MVYLTVGENSEFHSVLPLLHQLTIRLSASLNPFHLTHLCTLCHQGDLEHLLGPLESVTCALFAKKQGVPTLVFLTARADPMAVYLAPPRLRSNRELSAQESSVLT